MPGARSHGAGYWVERFEHQQRRIRRHQSELLAQRGDGLGIAPGRSHQLVELPLGPQPPEQRAFDGPIGVDLKDGRPDRPAEQPVAQGNRCSQSFQSTDEGNLF